MSKSDVYQRRAAECLIFAKQAKDQVNRRLLLEMAQTWAMLAVHTRKKAEKASRSFTMSSIEKFIRPSSSFDPDTLTILGDVYDRVCAQFCSCRQSPACDAMADRIFAAAMAGEKDPDKLWQIAVRPHTQ